MKTIKFIYLSLLIFITSCGIKLGRNDREQRNLPAASMQDFLYTYTEKSGFREWEIKAAQANTYDKSDIVYLYNFTMTLFSESNQIKSVLVANKGSIQQNIGNLIADGEVRIFSANQSELQTEKVYWDQNKELFYSETNKLVTYTRGSHKITGYDMVSDSALEHIELNNSVGQILTDSDDSQQNSSSTNSSKEFENEFKLLEDEEAIEGT
ncbi:MAG: LPS export ABC transporter periplasmic protein LptC [Spirochaetota bacterium]|nr:LPS export ABC transporter periplasmic protein LptC [Spirochaetota bacterium]